MSSKPVVSIFRSLIAVICALALVPGDTFAYVTAQSVPSQSSSQVQSAKISPEQLDSLVAPIALYPLFSGCG